MNYKSHAFRTSMTILSLLFASQLQAVTITPNITTDPALVGPNTGTDCSLRYAIESVNNGAFEGGCAAVSTGSFASNDTVVLGVGDYLLSLSGADEDDNAEGDLDVLVDVVIQGAGAEQTSIDASGIDGGDRVIHFVDSVSTLRAVTITGGDVTSAGTNLGGGVLFESGTLNIESIIATGNAAVTGGGISTNFNFNNPVLTIDSSTIAENSSLGCGGGIFLFLATVGISNSTINTNDAQDSDGGGICQSGDELFLVNTTISDNTAASDGGGIWTEFSGSTGGIKGSYNVTIAFNTAGGVGGGISGDQEFGPAGNLFATRIFNTIIARNTATSGTGNDCANGNFFTGGYNLIGEIGPNDNCQDFVDGVNGDQVGTPGSAIDPLLGPLQLNSGLSGTNTHALLVGSPAIDRANPNGCQEIDFDNFVENDTAVFLDLSTDQRLLTRPVAVLDPNVPICDIGAYEFQVAVPTPTPTPSATPIVTPTPPPVFQGFIEGSGCSLASAAPASAQGFAFLSLLGALTALAYRRFRG